MKSKSELPNVPNSLRYWHSEADSFQAVVNALDTTLQTDVVDSDRWRKLAHVRFVSTMLQRFLDRLFASEECEHLTELEQHPKLHHRIEELRREHVTLRNGMSEALFQLERTCAANAKACDESFARLTQLLKLIHRHMQKENELVQDCYDQDIGGEAG